MRDYDPTLHAEGVRTKNWSWAKFPVPGVLRRPWHPDGDKAFRTAPERKVPESDRIIAHLKRTASWFLSDGSTTPDYVGKTEGTFVNFAKPTDQEYTISRDNGVKNLTVTTGYNAPYGAKVRIGEDFIVQGYPMNEYSDAKMHIVDLTARTVTEIQYITEARRNPMMHAAINFSNWMRGLFGQPPLGLGFHCHGVKQYSLDVPSTDPSVQGSSAANISLLETTARYDDFVQGFAHMMTCGVPQGKKGEFVYPATSSDGPSLHADAIKFGQILRLKESSFNRMYQAVGPHARFLLCCWYMYGIMVVDTAGHFAVVVEPDDRWDHAQLRELSRQVSIEDFAVWEMN